MALDEQRQPACEHSGDEPGQAAQASERSAQQDRAAHREPLHAARLQQQPRPKLMVERAAREQVKADHRQRLHDRREQHDAERDRVLGEEHLAARDRQAVEEGQRTVVVLARGQPGADREAEQPEHERARAVERVERERQRPHVDLLGQQAGDLGEAHDHAEHAEGQQLAQLLAYQCAVQGILMRRASTRTGQSSTASSTSIAASVREPRGGDSGTTTFGRWAS
jgi:hypothetical protein